MNKALFLVFFLVTAIYSQEKTGLLLLGEKDNDSGQITWSSTRVSIDMSPEKMELKSIADQIPTPVGVIDSLTLFSTNNHTYMGGGSKMNKKDGVSPGVNGVNVLIDKDKNGCFRGDGYMFYPFSGHVVQVLLFINESP